MGSKIVTFEAVEDKIILISEQKVTLDSDVAALYEEWTGILPFWNHSQIEACRIKGELYSETNLRNKRII